MGNNIVKCPNLEAEEEAVLLAATEVVVKEALKSSKATTRIRRAKVLVAPEEATKSIAIEAATEGEELVVVATETNKNTKTSTISMPIRQRTNSPTLQLLVGQPTRSSMLYSEVLVVALVLKMNLKALMLTQLLTTS